MRTIVAIALFASLFGTACDALNPDRPYAAQPNQIETTTATNANNGTIQGSAGKLPWKSSSTPRPKFRR